MNNSSIQVGLISDQTLLLEGLKDCLNEQPGLSVTLATEDIGFAKDQISRSELQVLILDADHSSGRVLELAAQVDADCRTVRLIFLASAVQVPFVRRALLLNTYAYLTKAEPTSVIVEAVRGTVSGQRRFSSQVERWIRYDESRHRFDVVDPIAEWQLNDRQLSILRHLASGDSAKEVARKLSLSPKSIENYSYRIMRKLGVQDRVQLCRFAIRHGLIEA